jgi:hypothetical protein
LIGFHAMKYSESDRTVHNLIYSRFPVAPGIIIYDNCCNLHLFALAREPLYYKDTLFDLDRLHENSHGCCSPAYSPDEHIQLRNANTQIAEQKKTSVCAEAFAIICNGAFYVPIPFAILHVGLRRPLPHSTKGWNFCKATTW